MKKAIISALKAKYFGQIEEARANIEIYLENPVGIGEHPEIIDAIDTQISKLAEAQEKFQALEELDNGRQ
jgi:methylaspartate ammonia-lyase